MQQFVVSPQHIYDYVPELKGRQALAEPTTTAELPRPDRPEG